MVDLFLIILDFTDVFKTLTMIGLGLPFGPGILWAIMISLSGTSTFAVFWRKDLTNSHVFSFSSSGTYVTPWFWSLFCESTVCLGYSVEALLWPPVENLSILRTSLVHSLYFSVRVSTRPSNTSISLDILSTRFVNFFSRATIFFPY